MKAKGTSKLTEKVETYNDKIDGNKGDRRSKWKSGLPEILMPKTCIFCQRLHKKVCYFKEYMIRCQGKNVVISIQATQEKKQWENIAHILSNHNLLANEAHYLPSCYRSFTKLPQERKSLNSELSTQKATVLDQLYDYI